jgi:Asp-tRNA(Asn)/Glu-tRNA(Gln) amidotransferase A subunit family amidase
MQTEPWRLGIVDLAKAIREKQVSSREVIQAHLDHIHTVNGRLNAVHGNCASSAGKSEELHQVGNAPPSPFAFNL